jgi:SAM-dependent methyltransferase
MYERWGENLERWLRGQPWQSSQALSAEPAKFGAAMQAMGSLIARKVLAALDIDDVERMVDIGGGFGQYARTFCRARPGLRATVVDRPEVVALGREQVADSDLAGRVEFIGGDYLEVDYGRGYDLALLANILHQESAEHAAHLTRKAAGALAPGGRLVVLDFAIDDQQQQHVLGALFAINMRSFGDTYPEPTLRGWFDAAGLREVERIDLPPHRWLIVGRKP